MARVGFPVPSQQGTNAAAWGQYLLQKLLFMIFELARHVCGEIESNRRVKW